LISRSSRSARSRSPSALARVCVIAAADAAGGGGRAAGQLAAVPGGIDGRAVRGPDRSDGRPHVGHGSGHALGQAPHLGRDQREATAGIARTWHSLGAFCDHAVVL
jgi:hypothetical protein